MRRATENPKKFVVSCRVNMKEMRDLQERAEERGISITSLVRKCLELSEQQYSSAN